MKMIAKNLAATLLFVFFTSSAQAINKPNIVLVFMDNFGWG